MDLPKNSRTKLIKAKEEERLEKNYSTSINEVYGFNVFVSTHKNDVVKKIAQIISVCCSV